MFKLFRVRQSGEGYYRVNRIAKLHTAQRICGTAQFDKIVPPRQAFQTRHIGPSDAQKQQMLQVVGCKVNNFAQFLEISLAVYAIAVTLCNVKTKRSRSFGTQILII